jgi:hypothetical protein
MPIVVSHQPSASLTLQLAEAGGKGEYRKWHAQFEQQQEDQKTQAFLGAFGMGSQIGLAGKQMKHQKSMQAAQFAQQTKMGNIRSGVTAAANAATIQSESAVRDGNRRIFQSILGGKNPLASAASMREIQAQVEYFSRASSTDPGASRTNSAWNVGRKMLQEYRGNQQAGTVRSILGTESAHANRTAAKIQAMAGLDQRMGVMPDQALGMQESIAAKTPSGVVIYEPNEHGQGGLVGTATDPKNSMYTGASARQFLEGTKAKMRVEQDRLQKRIQKEIENSRHTVSRVMSEDGNVLLGIRNVRDKVTGIEKQVDWPELGDQFEKYRASHLEPYAKMIYGKAKNKVDGAVKAYIDGKQGIEGGSGETQFQVTDRSRPSGFRPVRVFRWSGGKIYLSDLPDNQGRPEEEWRWAAGFLGVPKEVRGAPKNPDGDPLTDHTARGKLKWPPGPNDPDYDPEDWLIPPEPKAMPASRKEWYQDLKETADRHKHEPEHWSVLLANKLGLMDGVTIPNKYDEDPEGGFQPEDAAGGIGEPLRPQARTATGVNLRGMSTPQRIMEMWKYGKRKGFIPEGTPDHEMPTDIGEMERMVRSHILKGKGAVGPPGDFVGRPEGGKEEAGWQTSFDPKSPYQEMRGRGKAAMGAVVDIEKNIKSAPKPKAAITGSSSKVGADFALKQRQSLKAITVLKRWLPKIADPGQKMDPGELKGVGVVSEAEIRKRVKEALATLQKHGYWDPSLEMSIMEQGGVPEERPEMGPMDPPQPPMPSGPPR